MNCEINTTDVALTVDVSCPIDGMQTILSQSSETGGMERVKTHTITY